MAESLHQAYVREFSPYNMNVLFDMTSVDWFGSFSCGIAGGSRKNLELHRKPFLIGKLVFHWKKICSRAQMLFTEIPEHIACNNFFFVNNKENNKRHCNKKLTKIEIVSLKICVIFITNWIFDKMPGTLSRMKSFGSFEFSWRMWDDLVHPLALSFQRTNGARYFLIRLQRFSG